LRQGVEREWSREGDEWEGPIAGSLFELTIALGRVEDYVSLESHSLFRAPERNAVECETQREREREQTCDSSCNMFNRDFLLFPHREDDGIDRVIVSQHPNLGQQEMRKTRGVGWGRADSESSEIKRVNELAKRPSSAPNNQISS
jgi:hypothetical protein